MDEEPQQRTITVSATITVDYDNEKTATEKANLVIENLQGQANAVRGQFDTGVAYVGTATLDGESPTAL